MKKAYVRVKRKREQSILKRPYIAATVIGASVCAIALSLTVKPPNRDQAEHETVLSAPSARPEEANEAAAPSALPSAAAAEQKPAQQDVPSSKETAAPADQTKNEEPAAVAAVPQAEEESAAVGLFGESASVSFIKPVDAEISQPYSGTKPVKSKTLGDWRIHTGVDIYAEQGTEVKAPADGTVQFAGEDALTGHTVTIDHGNGVVSTVYNLESTDRVEEGQTVKAGDVIGTAGQSAQIEMLEDPHIHFEVQIDGAYVNPEEYLS